MKKIIAALLCVVMFSGPAAYASTYNNKLNDVNKNLKGIKNEINAKKNVVKDINSIILELDSKIQQSETKIVAIQKDIDVTKEKIVVTEGKIVKLEENIDTNTDLLGKRLRVMYRTSDIDYLQILFNSKDIEELLSNMNMIKKVVNQDKEILEELKGQKEEVEVQKASLVKEERSMATYKSTMEAEMKVLEQNKKQQDENKNAVITDIKKLEQMENSLIKEANDLQQKIRDLSKSKGIGGNYKGGVMGWPVSGGGRVTSNFGYRIHPILKTKKLHTGLDISASSGTGILAANAGRVIYSGVRGTYGKTIIIDHGGGIVTLYAHCSSLVASEGQDVKKGDVVAKVGSTGLSTGPHLHFEVRVNGNYVDPKSYLGL